MVRNVVTTFQTTTIAASAMIFVNTILKVLGLVFVPLFLCCSSEGFQAPYSLLSEEFNGSFLESSLTFQQVMSLSNETNSKERKVIQAALTRKHSSFVPWARRATHALWAKDWLKFVDFSYYINKILSPAPPSTPASSKTPSTRPNTRSQSSSSSSADEEKHTSSHAADTCSRVKPIHTHVHS